MGRSLVVVATSLLVWRMLAGEQALGQAVATPAKRALLIGINDYDHPSLRQPAPLKYAVKDVTDLASLLKQAGYEVVLMTETVGQANAKLAPRKANIERELSAMSARCQRGDTFLLALAGHGLQFGKNAYFCPQDARPFESATESLFSVSKIYEQLEQSFAGTKLVLVDACRNDPTPGRGRNGIDADGAPPPQGVGVLFSCNRGQRAYEHDTLQHGVFFHYILEGLKGQARDPDGIISFEGLSYFVRKNVPGRVQQLFPGVEQIPNLKADLAGIPILIESVARAPQPIRNSLGMTLLYCAPGEFSLGSPKTEKGRQYGDVDETQHTVVLTKGFYLSAEEVTVGAFRKFADAANYRTDAERDGKGGGMWNGSYLQSDPARNWRDPGFPQTDAHPVVNVSWNDANAFCKWLTQQEGRTYRLPTEAEWEYACRAGSTTAYSCGDDPEGLAKIANVADASAKERIEVRQSIEGRDGYVYTSPAGSFSANAWGFHDLHGNVAEWCTDWYSDYPQARVSDPLGTAPGASGRVIRGGGWQTLPRNCRSAFRDRAAPVFRHHALGFRVVQDVQP